VGTDDAPEGAGHFGEKVFDGLELNGNARTPAILAGTIYTYDNANLSGDNVPSVLVYYTYFGEELSKEFSFAAAENPAALTRNNLYGIQFVFTGGESEYKAGTWEDGGTTAEIFSKQEALNRQLAVNRFVGTNVKTLDTATGAVTFCLANNSENISTSADANYFTQWSSDFASVIYTGADGKRYRVPTRDEMQLIATTKLFTISTIDNNKNTGNVAEPLGDLFGVPGSGGAGTSDFRCIIPDGQEFGLTYAIRFRNTLQYAAYRYSVMNYAANNDNSYLSVQIKALGMSTPTMDDVCNEAFWADGEYIEVIFPFSGTNIGTQRGTYSRYWSSTADTDSKSFYLYNNTAMSVASTSNSTFGNLRLVCVD
jgi:hypothetical protein